MEPSDDRVGTEKDMIAIGCALNRDDAQQLINKAQTSSESAENCNNKDLATLKNSELRSSDEEQPSDGGAEATLSRNSEVAERRVCRSVVVYSKETVGMQGALQFSWETDRAGYRVGSSLVDQPHLVLGVDRWG